MYIDEGFKHKLLLSLIGKPQCKQSARFRGIKKGDGKTQIVSYQPAEIKDMETIIKMQVISQLPKTFRIISTPCEVNVTYMYALPQQVNKKIRDAVNIGKRVFKHTKPDVSDNLNKGLLDAMEGIVMINDSLVVQIHAQKVYGLTNQTLVEIKY